MSGLGMQYAHIKIYVGNAFKASASYSVTCNTSNPNPTPSNPMTTSTNTLRFHAAGLSVPDELYWYNNNTHWNALSRKEFRSLMIRMESITAQHYEDVRTTGRSNRSAAIKAFWAEEWGCEYQPESGKWLNLTTNAFFQSETEKKAQRDAKKALKEAKKEKRESER